MDHKEALETLATEKYLLNEFSPEERDSFEEHFFSCEACAQDVRAGAAFMDQGKIALRPDKRPIANRRPIAFPAKRPWFAWLRPAMALPAMALLLGIVVFQNLVQFPAMERSLTAMNAPAVLPSAYLAGGGTRGASHVVAAQPGEPFLLLIDIPGESNAAYTAELYDAAGQKKWSLGIPESFPKEGLSIRMPGNLPAGSYSLAVRSAGAPGHASAEISKYSFELQRQ